MQSLSHMAAASEKFVRSPTTQHLSILDLFSRVHDGHDLQFLNPSDTDIKAPRHETNFFVLQSKIATNQKPPPFNKKKREQAERNELSESLFPSHT